MLWTTALALLAADSPSTLAKVGIPVMTIALGAVVTWFWRYRDHVEKTAGERELRISALEKKLAVVETQISPMWAAVQSKIVKDLLHPSPQFKEMDRLLRSLEKLTITEEERQRLHVLLEERITSTDPEVNDSEKKSAALMKGIMEKVIDEAADEAGSAVTPSRAS